MCEQWELEYTCQPLGPLSGVVGYAVLLPVRSERDTCVWLVTFHFVQHHVSGSFMTSD